MIPLPIENFIPKLFIENLSDSGQSFIDLMNNEIQTLFDETFGLEKLRHPEQCPGDLLDVLGQQFAANIKNYDSEIIKRKKIFSAVKGHKTKGTWVFNVKIIIQNITNIEPFIFTETNSDDWILLGDSDDPDNFWAILGGDGTEFNSDGMFLIGDGTEVEVSGIVSIDLVSDSLSSQIIDSIKLELEDDIVPAYFRVNLGFVDIDGHFEIYPNGVIE